MEIVKAEDFGIEESRAQEVSAAFAPMLENMTALEQEYNEIIEESNSGEITKALAKKARETRLKFVRARSEVGKKHKEMKAFYLAGGRFVDGIKNAHKMAAGDKEENLKKIETYLEEMEKKRLAELREERIEMLRPYTESFPEGMENWEIEVFNNYFSGAKKSHADRIEEERLRKEEEERKRKEEEERRAREEAARLKKEEEDRKAREVAEKKAAEERKKREAAEEKARKEREALEAKMEKERKEREEAERKHREKVQKEREELEAKLEKERKEREAAEKKLEEERREREAAEEAKLGAKDADKVDLLIQDLKSLKDKYKFRSKKKKEMYNSVGTLLDKTVDYIEKHN